MRFRARLSSSEPGFQIAPMIDVVFLLLSFFIATQIYSQWETELDITLPTAKSGEVPQRLPGEIILNILPDGTVVVNKKTLNEEDLGSLLNRVVELFPGSPVLIRADRETPYGFVIRVLDMCASADIWNVSFAATEPEQETRK
ncbi:MAG: biopolymer transporter ExbD [Kiritimatiellia bacterium]